MKNESECAAIWERIKTGARRLFQQLHPVTLGKALGCLILVGLHSVFMWFKRAWGNLLVTWRRFIKAQVNLFWALVHVVKAAVWLLAVVFVGVVLVAVIIWRFPPSACESGHSDPGLYLDQRINMAQCWSDDQRKMFYATHEGSLIIPYDLLKALERPKSAEPFLSKATIERYGFLPLEEGDFEPFSSAMDADSLPPKSSQDWPLGFVLYDHKQGEWAGKWFGLTCAACHTAEIHYSKDRNGKPLRDKDGHPRTLRLRVDGGPALADINGFLDELNDSLKATYCSAKVYFAERSKTDKKPHIAESAQYRSQCDEYEAKPDRTKFDRFLLNFKEKPPEQLYNELRFTRYAHESWHSWNNPKSYREAHAHGFGRLDAFGVIFNQLLNLAGTREAANAPNAPVSYPYLWDTSQHDWTQWNGIAPRIPKGRNIGQMVGTFGKFDFPPGFTVVGSIPLKNLRELQNLVDTLRSPAWPEDILGLIDRESDPYKRGKAFYERRCQYCHAIQERDKPLKRINVNLADADGVGSLRTDPLMTYNAHTRQAYGSEGPKPIQAILLKTTTYILFHPENWLWHPVELFDTFVEFLSPPLECNLRWVGRGLWGLVKFKWQWERERCFFQDTSRMFYKGRPLDGIWATAPYLHNGSVANLYELQLPADERAKEFCVGQREFDPDRVGFVMLSKAECDARRLFWLDTSLPGNWKTGHEYGVQRCGSKNDTCMEKRHQEISDLLAYLKSL
jgi:hypothetical protein